MQIELNAGWFTPANGQGPATLTVSLRNKATLQLKNALQLSIAPGTQQTCSSTPVAVVTVTAPGPWSTAAIKIEVVVA